MFTCMVQKYFQICSKEGLTDYLSEALPKSYTFSLQVLAGKFTFFGDTAEKPRIYDMEESYKNRLWSLLKVK